MSPLFSKDVAELQRMHSTPGFQPIPLDLARLPSPGDIRCASQLRRHAFPPGTFDVLHAHSTKAGFLARVFLTGVARALVYSPHAPLSMNPLLAAPGRLAVRWLERMLASRSTAIICVSQAEKAHLESIGIPPRLLAVIPNGITTRKLEPRETARRLLQAHNGTTAIGFVGRIAPQKGLDVLLRALTQLPSVPWTLFVAGDGPERARMEQLAAQLGFQQRIRWLGEQPVDMLLSGFDVFVLPSRYESLPYSLIEAMAAKLPVVATSAGGVTELVVDGGNGLLVAPGDPAPLAFALQRLVSDTELSAHLAAQAAVTASSFTADRMVDQTLNLYRAIT